MDRRPPAAGEPRTPVPGDGAGGGHRPRRLCDRHLGGAEPALLAGALSPVAAVLLLATGRSRLADAGFLLGCYAVPAALLAAMLAAFS